MAEEVGEMLVLRLPFVLLSLPFCELRVSQLSPLELRGADELVEAPLGVVGEARCRMRGGFARGRRTWQAVIGSVDEVAAVQLFVGIE